MKKEDMPRFAELVCGVHEMRQLPPPTATSLQMSFNALARYPMFAIEAGIQLVVSSPGEVFKIPLTPAHILAAMERHIAEVDMRPSAAEAWALAIQAHDERNTVRLTAEVLIAMTACRALMDGRDSFAARQAFVSAYERAVQEARRAHKMPEWTLSLGTHPEMRQEAVQSAQAAGLLPAPHAQLLIGGPDPDPHYDHKMARENLDRLKKMCATMGSGVARRRKQQAAEAERKRLAEAKEALAPCDTDLMPMADLANPPGKAIEPKARSAVKGA